MADINGINNPNIFEDLGLTKKKTDDKNNELGQTDFLKLLVAQMENQDPLQPQENGDFLAQMAQFSATDGISKMQQSLEALTNSLQSNQALQASALVGRSVLVPGSVSQLETDGEIKGMASLKASATNVTMQIYNSSGVMVKEEFLGNHQAGDMPFKWDGTTTDGERAPNGSYEVKVFGNVAGKQEQIGTQIAANVNSVTLGRNGEGVKLNVAGIGQVSIDDVLQISE